MLKRAKDLKSFSMLATDGELGSLSDFYFDSDSAVIRYFVGDTRTWFFGGKVLLSPMLFDEVDTKGERVRVNATKDQIKNSPKPEEHEPVTRKYEKLLSSYYGFDGYWVNRERPNDMTGFQAHAPMMPPIFDPVGHNKLEDDGVQKDIQQAHNNESNQHLISVEDIKGYSAYSTGGEVGSIRDCIIDDADWSIRYFVVDVGGFFNKEYVLVSIDWLEDVDWKNNIMTFKLEKELIETAPDYISERELTREDEAKLYAHYNKPVYWEKERITR